MYKRGTISEVDQSRDDILAHVQFMHFVPVILSYRYLTMVQTTA